MERSLVTDYQSVDIMDVIVDKGGLASFLEEVAIACEQMSDDDIKSMPDNENGKTFRRFWLTASAELLAFRERLEGLD